MKRIVKTIIYSIIVINTTNLNAQEIIPLYTGEIPNSKPTTNKEKSELGADGILRISEVSVPTLSIYALKNQKKNPAVIICPGGGYKILAASHEGSDVAKALNQMGVTAFVLKYRIPDDSTMPDKSIGPLQDAQRAIQMVRENVEKWGVDPSKIGIMGFSAGGHLAASASTRYDEQVIENPKQTSLRPDFSILIYPVISFMEEVTHKGSRTNLLGPNQGQQKLERYSNELNTSAQSPPAFLVHAGDDVAVPAANSIRYYEALLKHKIYSSLIIYPHGGHGFGMNNKTTADKWMDSLKNWLNSMKML